MLTSTKGGSVFGYDIFMSEINVQQYLQLLKKSELLETADFESWLSRAETFASAKYLARQLVEEKVLTSWQAKFLLSGRHRLRIGNYVLLGRSKTSRFGDRFIALHPSLGRNVELTVFSKEVTEAAELSKAFLHKASQVAELDHQNLVHVFDIDRAGDRYYLVAEQVDVAAPDTEGVDEMDETEIARRIVAVGRALQFAHQHEVTHGSLEVADIVVAQDGRVRVHNLAMGPLRQPHNLDKVPDPQDDFNALSRIGLDWLSEHKDACDSNRRLEVKESLIDLRDQPGQSLDTLELWLQSAPVDEVRPPELKALSAVAATDSGKLSDSQRDDDLDALPKSSGFIGQQFQERPVQLLASIGILLVLIGFGVIYYLLQNPAGAVASDENLVADSTKVANEDRKVGASSVAKPKKTRGNRGPKAKPSSPTDNQQNAQVEASKAGTPKGNPKTPDKAKPVAATEKKEVENAAVKSGTAKAPAKPTKPAGPVIPKAEKKTPDDLTKIVGIGDKTQEVFNEGGVTTLLQLSKMEPQHVVAVIRKGGLSTVNLEKAKQFIASAKKKHAEMVKANAAKNAAAAKKSNAYVAVKFDAPFQSIAAPFQLPPTNNTKSKTLVSFELPKNKLLGLSLVSPQGAVRGKTVYETRREDKDGRQRWVVMVRKNSKSPPVDIAALIKEPKSLDFAWLAKAEKNRLAQSLQNCFLKLFVPGGATAVVPMRRPVRIPSIRLDPKTMQGELQIDLVGLPAPESIAVEISPIASGKAYLDMAKKIATPDSTAFVYFRNLRRNRSQGDNMWFGVSLEVKSKLEVKAGVLALNQLRQAIVVRDYEALKVRHGQLRVQEQLAENRYSNNRRDESLKTALNKARSDLGKMDAYMKAIAQLLKVPINIRIIGNFGGYRVLLARSNPDYTVAQYRKDRKNGKVPWISYQPWLTPAPKPEKPAEDKKPE